MLKTKYLFEIQVYRVNETAYYDAMDEHINEINSDMEFPVNTEYLRDKFGGDWQYNEIIGFLKFYQYGANQIRCEYWETAAVRKVKTRKKQFIKISDSYCRVLFWRNDTNAKLASVMKIAVEHCEVRLTKKKRYLDKELFNNTADNIAWKNILI